jgi:hypothetical protein
MTGVLVSIGTFDISSLRIIHCITPLLLTSDRLVVRGRSPKSHYTGRNSLVAEFPACRPPSLPYSPSNMTTNLNGIAGPSRRSPSPKADGLSPSSETGLKDGDSSAAKLDSMRVDENGEVIKVPAFLNKLFRWVSGGLGNGSCAAATVQSWLTFSL